MGPQVMLCETKRFASSATLKHRRPGDWLPGNASCEKRALECIALPGQGLNDAHALARAQGLLLGGDRRATTAACNTGASHRARINYTLQNVVEIGWQQPEGDSVQYIKIFYMRNIGIARALNANVSARRALRFFRLLCVGRTRANTMVGQTLFNSTSRSHICVLFLQN